MITFYLLLVRLFAFWVSENRNSENQATSKDPFFHRPPGPSFIYHRAPKHVPTMPMRENGPVWDGQLPDGRSQFRKWIRREEHSEENRWILGHRILVSQASRVSVTCRGFNATNRYISPRRLSHYDNYWNTCFSSTLWLCGFWTLLKRGQAGDIFG